MSRGPFVVLSSLAVRRILRRAASLADISARTWTLCQAEVRTVPPAIYLEESLGRISGVGADTTVEREMRRIRGGEVEHAATVVHTVPKARLHRGSVYAGAWKYRLLDPSKSASPQGEEPWVARTGALACTFYGSMYFGHWLRDDLSLSLAVESLDHPLVVARPLYRHEPGYRDLFGLETPACTAAIFERLLVLIDHGQNSFKRKRYQELRARLRRRFPDNGSRLIYIRRGTLGARDPRALINREEVERFVGSLGFRIVDPDALPCEDIVRQIMGAKIVISTEGSHLGHAAYAMGEDSVLCVLQPPNRFNNVYKDFTDCLGHRYAFVVGAPAEGGFVVQLDDLQRILAAIEKQLRL